ncbi:hypothetical protein Q9966_012706 [Columba livia]|nr:hypothetical protein Q9966_012706 [Columba livia]
MFPPCAGTHVDSEPPVHPPGWELALSGAMGSTGPGLTALPPGRAPRPEPALLPPPRDPDTHSWGCPDSPSPPGTPEQPVPAFCLHYFDMLYTEDIAWATKGTGDPSPSGAPGGRGEAPKEPEQCPIIDSQGPALGAGGGPARQPGAGGALAGAGAEPGAGRGAEGHRDGLQATQHPRRPCGLEPRQRAEVDPVDGAPVPAAADREVLPGAVGKGPVRHV